MNERQKYEAMWVIPAYRKHSPGERDLARFRDVVAPSSGASIIDFGCGCGRPGLTLARNGFDVTMIDIAANALDDKVRQEINGRLRFVQHDLTEPLPIQADYGYCTDVMEHIPTDDVGKVLDTIFACAPRVFFGIALRQDSFGSKIGETLHLTVKPVEWWREQLEPRCEIEWSWSSRGEALFYTRRHG